MDGDCKRDIGMQKALSFPLTQITRRLMLVCMSGTGIILARILLNLELILPSSFTFSTSIPLLAYTVCSLLNPCIQAIEQGMYRGRWHPPTRWTRKMYPRHATRKSINNSLEMLPFQSTNLIIPSDQVRLHSPSTILNTQLYFNLPASCFRSKTPRSPP
jgi:hypothetical protein